MGNRKRFLKNKRNASKNVFRSMKLKTDVIGEETRNRLRVDRNRKCSFVEEICFINQLPPEILDIVFSHISGKDRKNVRLVCKSWYERNQPEYVVIDRLDGVASKYLEDCGFKCWNLHFKNYCIDMLPLTVWEKIGTNLISISFYNCRLGNIVMKSVISFCDNLQSLRVILTHGDSDIAFCSPETLEELCIVRKNLKMFKIIGGSWPYTPTGYRFGKWKRIFEALFRIFPNVRDYASGCECIRNRSGQENEEREEFLCAYKTALDEHEKSRISSSVAHSLCTRTKAWRTVINALSTMRLSKLELNFVKLSYTEDDEIALLNCFTNQKELKSVEISFGENMNLQMLKAILFNICENCPSLRELNFYRELSWEHHIDKPWMYYWLHDLTATELSQLQSKTTNLEKLSFDSFIIKKFSLHTTSAFIDDKWLHPQFERSLTCLIQTYSNLRSLTLTNNISDKGLQNIFRYMTRLETLKIRLHATNTNFGMTGRREEFPESSIDSYSISRLRDLERLEIEWCSGCQVNDITFSEFYFPKLRYLYSFPPYDSSILLHWAEKMPCLKEINFSWICLFPPKILLDFCRLSKNLHSVHLMLSTFRIGKVKEIFEICPTLRFLHTYLGSYYWEPFTNQVILKENTKYSYHKYMDILQNKPWRFWN